jgi:murein L,D-transpeptidase YcbB/YkuD
MMHAHRLVPMLLAATALVGQDGAGDTADIRASLTRAGPAVRAFYAARDYAPAWTGEGRAGPAARELAAALVTLEQHGLDPARYGTARIERLLAIGADSSAALDVALTTAFLAAGRQLGSGRIRPAEVDSFWRGTPRAVDVTAALRRAAEQQRPAAELAALAPPHPAYHALRAALSRYRGAMALVGGPAWAAGRCSWPATRASASRHCASVSPRKATSATRAAPPSIRPPPRRCGASSGVTA